MAWWKTIDEFASWTERQGTNNEDDITIARLIYKKIDVYCEYWVALFPLKTFKYS